MFIPYTYLIKWSSTGKYYYGSQYGKFANPLNLWKTYFTSSKYVSEYRKSFGDPDIIQIRRTFSSKEECLHWENRVLKKIIKDKNCLNISSNLGIHAICISGYVTVKDSTGNTSLVSIDDPMYISGQLKHIAHGTTSVIDPKTGKTFRVSNKDPRFLSGELISTNKGKPTPNQTGRIWINDGSKNKYVFSCELDHYLMNGFVRGKLQSKTTRDYSATPNSQLGTCWIFHPNYGPKKIKKELLQTFLSEGWTKGRVGASGGS